MTDTRTAAELHAEHEARMQEKEVLEIAYHRNGVGGSGFYVALVRDPEVEQRVFVAIVPAWAVDDVDSKSRKSPDGGIPCFVIDPKMASGPWTKPGTVKFGENSWRGDHFFDVVVKAAKEWQRQQD